MSGGHFDYKQYVLGDIADQIQELIDNNENETLTPWHTKKGNFFNEKTIAEFKAAVYLLRSTQILVHRIDWLVSGDDGEENFHQRLFKDLEKLVKGSVNETMF